MQANEKADVADRTKGSVVEQLIPLVDSFEQAKAALKPETEAEKKIDASYQVQHYCGPYRGENSLSGHKSGRFGCHMSLKCTCSGFAGIHFQHAIFRWCEDEAWLGCKRKIS